MAGKLDRLLRASQIFVCGHSHLEPVDGQRQTVVRIITGWTCCQNFVCGLHIPKPGQDRWQNSGQKPGQTLLVGDRKKLDRNMDRKI